MSGFADKDQMQGIPAGIGPTLKGGLRNSRLKSILLAALEGHGGQVQAPITGMAKPQRFAEVLRLNTKALSPESPTQQHRSAQDAQTQGPYVHAPGPWPGPSTGQTTGKATTTGPTRPPGPPLRPACGCKTAPVTEPEHDHQDQTVTLQVTGQALQVGQPVPDCGPTKPTPTATASNKVPSCARAQARRQPYVPQGRSRTPGAGQDTGGRPRVDRDTGGEGPMRAVQAPAQEPARPPSGGDRRDPVTVSVHVRSSASGRKLVEPAKEPPPAKPQVLNSDPTSTVLVAYDAGRPIPPPQTGRADQPPALPTNTRPVVGQVPRPVLATQQVQAPVQTGPPSQAPPVPGDPPAQARGQAAPQPRPDNPPVVGDTPDRPQDAGNNPIAVRQATSHPEAQAHQTNPVPRVPQDRQAANPDPPDTYTSVHTDPIPVTPGQSPRHPEQSQPDLLHDDTPPSDLLAGQTELAAVVQAGSDRATPQAMDPPDVTMDRPDGLELEDQVAVALRGALARDQQGITIELHPPELGRVVIRFEVNQDAIEGTLEVSNRQTYLRLEQGIQQVTHNLQSQGVQVRHLELTLAHQGQPYDPSTGQGYDQYPQGQHWKQGHQPHIELTDLTQTSQRGAVVRADGSIDMLA